jgi:hypothetical protein
MWKCSRQSCRLVAGVYALLAVLTRLRRNPGSRNIDSNAHKVSQPALLLILGRHFFIPNGMRDL